MFSLDSEKTTREIDSHDKRNETRDEKYTDHDEDTLQGRVETGSGDQKNGRQRAVNRKETVPSDSRV